MHETASRPRMADATSTTSRGVTPRCWTACTSAYTSHASDDTPQPLPVLTTTGTHGRPKSATASQNTTRSTASERHSVSASMFPMAKTAACSLAYGKCPVAASARPTAFSTTHRTKRRLYTVNRPWSSRMTPSLERTDEARFAGGAGAFAFFPAGTSSAAATAAAVTAITTSAPSTTGSSSSSSRSRSQKWLLARLWDLPMAEGKILDEPRLNSCGSQTHWPAPGAASGGGTGGQ
ncbi:hypothetical protein U9M48_018457 [Paspalum notatum var. saurae]|uniref:Uncharacterized protein n=1 Tax=Paspalum notatum var. saurae TaxID=547442 RepID=A0AAQ3TCW6_PASNO